MVMEGKVTVTESSRRIASLPIGQTVLGVVGTGDGIKPNVLVNNTPKVFSTAQEFLDMITPDAGEPTGSLWTVAQDLLHGARDNIIVVQAEDNSSANIVAAINALRQRVNNRVANLVATIDHVAVASGNADPIITAMESVCETIKASFVYNIGVTGADKDAQITNAKLFAGANAQSRGIAIFGRNESLDNESVKVIAAMGLRDAQSHEGVSFSGMRIRGVVGTNPELDYLSDGRNDVDNLLESNIVPLIEDNGVITSGYRYSGFSVTSDNPFRFIGVRRTADKIARHGKLILQRHLRDSTIQGIIPVIAEDLESYLNSLVAINQIRAYNIIADNVRNTPQSLAQGHVFIKVEFEALVPVTGIGLEVVTATTSIS